MQTVLFTGSELSYRSILQVVSWELVGWDVCVKTAGLCSWHPAFYLDSVCSGCSLCSSRDVTNRCLWNLTQTKVPNLFEYNKCLVYFTEKLYNLWSDGPVPVRGLNKHLVSALPRDRWDCMQIVLWQHSGLPVWDSLSSSLPELAELNVLSGAFSLLSKLKVGFSGRKQCLGVSFIAECDGIVLG